MIVTNTQGLVAGAASTIIGTAVYTAGQVFGVLSKPLERRFREAGSSLVRHTLGSPRKVMGALLIASKGFLFVDAVAQRNWGFLGVLGLWTAGDIAVGLSTALAARRARKQARRKGTEPLASQNG